MERYKIRKGVVLEKVCGVYLLISTEEACPPCPYFREVNETIAFYWHLLEQGCTEEQLLEAAEEEYDAPSELLRSDLHMLLDSLKELGYLINNS